MTNAVVFQSTVVVDHVTIQSRNAFDAVKAKLEALLPPLDGAIMKDLENGEAERAMQRMEAGPPLSIFTARDHGGLLMVVGLQRRAIQYEIGNPLKASKMTRHQIAAALYAPIRVLLREDPNGGVAFEYDRPVSMFGQFCDPDVDAVAQSLDCHLQAVLTEAAGGS